MWLYIEKWLLKFKDSVLEEEGRIISYFDLLKLVRSKGEKFQRLVPRYSKCIILCKSELNTCISLFLCWYLKIIPIPLSPNYGERWLRKMIRSAESDFILTDELNNISEDCPVFNIENLSEGSIIDKNYNYHKGIEIILYTSGSTGMPKGVMLSKTSLLKNSDLVSNYLGLTSDDKILIVRPLYHCAVLTGELLAGLQRGTNIYFFNNTYNPFLLLDILKRSDFSFLGGTPTLLKQISNLARREKIFLKLDKLSISGEYLSKDVASLIRYSFPNTKIFNAYGQTEAGPRISYLDPTLFDAKSESAGQPLKGIEIEIFDKKTFQKLPSNSVGIIKVKTPCVMIGYDNNNNLTRHVLENGWLNTGDLGYKDENGYIYVLSRIDDLIIKNGMNIYPKEIENTVVKIPEISDCVAYSLRDNHIALDVVIDPRINNISQEILFKKIMESLPDFQKPTKIYVKNTLEKNLSGKKMRKRCIGETNEI